MRTPGERRALLALAAAAALVGGLTGLMAASFRVLLQAAGRLRDQVIGASHASSPWTLVGVVAACAGTAAAAAWLVRRVEPHAEGSGIPRVEAVVEGRIAPGHWRILPVKYVGGLLAMGGGLALGREGPCVQMGGNIAITVARLTRRADADLRMLVAGGAAAGLATAFNAPLAGGVFVLEELLKRFDTKASVATLVSSAAGFAGARLLLPDETEFSVRALAEPQVAHAPSVVVLGVLAGLLGVGYNALVMGALRIADRHPWPAEARAALIGGAVGLVGWFAPWLIGPGDHLTQSALWGQGALWASVGLLLARVALGVASYAAGTPGGLFAPMLVIGAQVGLIVGLVGASVAPRWTPQPAALAVIGLAAFFTASVRAPVTGLILASEMTGSVTLLPPMLGCCAVAMVVATALRGKPIYDLLTDRSVRWGRANAAGRPEGG